MNDKHRERKVRGFEEEKGRVGQAGNAVVREIWPTRFPKTASLRRVSRLFFIFFFFTRLLLLSLSLLP